MTVPFPYISVIFFLFLVCQVILQRIRIHLKYLRPQECFVFVRQDNLIQLSLQILFKMFFVSQPVVTAETFCTGQHIISYIVARIETLMSVDFLIDDRSDGSYQFILFHILIESGQLIVDRFRQGEVNTSFIIQDTRLHAQ